MPKLKTSELKVRCLLTKKAPTEKIENVMVPTSCPSSKCTEFRLLLCQEKEELEWQEVIDDHRHLGTIEVQERL